MKLMKHCAQCGNLKKQGLMPDYNFYDPSEIGEDNHCPKHPRVLHDVYVASDGEVHTLDRWDVTVFRGIIKDLVYEIRRNYNLYMNLNERTTSLEEQITKLEEKVE